MNLHFKDKKGFLMLLGLLLSVAIIIVMFYFLLNTYYKKPAIDEQTQKSISQEGIGTSSYKSIVDDTREKVRDIENRLQERENQLMEQTK